MINCKVKEIYGNQHLMQAFMKLQQSPVPISTGKLIMEIGKKLDEEIQKSDKTRQEILLKYCKKDEAGKPVLKEGNYDILEESKGAFQVDMTALFESDIEISLPKIVEKDLQHARLSPVEWEALTPFLGSASGLKLV